MSNKLELVSLARKFELKFDEPAKNRLELKMGVLKLKLKLEILAELGSFAPLEEGQSGALELGRAEDSSKKLGTPELNMINITLQFTSQGLFQRRGGGGAARRGRPASLGTRWGQRKWS
ncbi:UNVERIFIED_CONTAM: hypothetical protein Slati_1418800 [Sesamum latifolium]|uniref:Uncharacterized protein n=1 Tax=Sesamum latifolium TaxID=2727402 RepID=A0AAW2X3C5_9LAMI